MRDFDPTASEFVSSGYLRHSRPGGLLYEPTTILAGAALGSGILGAEASSNAADATAGAATQAAQTQKAMFDKTVELESPFRQAGLDATSRLSSLLGIGSNSSGDPSFGSLTHNFGMQDFQLDPGIQYQMQYGNQALTNKLAGKDGVLAGGSLKALLDYNQSLAGTGYQSAFDRYNANRSYQLGSLMGVANLGQAAAGNTVNGAPSFASSIGNSITGAGQAQGAGYIGSANALASGLGGAGNAYFLSSLLKNQTPAGGGGVVSDGASIGNFA